jgi:hypothetical protein
LPKIALQNYCFFLKWQRIAQKNANIFVLRQKCALSLDKIGGVSEIKN